MLEYPARIELGHNHKEKLQIEANEVSSFAKMILELRGAEGAIFIAIAGH